MLSLLSLVLGALAGPSRAAQDPAAPLVIEDWLALEAVDRRGRRPFRPDAVFARHLLDRSAPPPRAGDVVSGEIEGREARWTEREGAGDGRVDVEGAAWAYGALELAADEVRLVEARGATSVFVNGVAIAGDLYGYGTPPVPAAFRAGRNEVYACGLRGLVLRVHPRERALDLVSQDLTLPDLVRGERPSGAIGVVLRCAQLEPSGPLEVAVTGEGLAVAPLVLEEGLAPLAVRKVALALAGDVVRAGVESVAITLVLRRPGGEELARATAQLAVCERGTLRQSTYASDVDGAAIDYALLPPSGEPRTGTVGLVLSLHGAGVTARGQAACYAPKVDFWIVAPSNRRPYGFDWQDWGRRDAYDVLAEALARTGADESRVSVTGHSMGGHGAWNLAANDPDRFAACAPSAGWESFDSYGGRPDGARAALWRAADAASLTAELASNFHALHVYVLHGTDDETVPVRETLRMSEALARVGATFDLHLEGGAGHWWGNRCVDWEPMFELFARARRADAPLRIDWTSVDPRVDARHAWLRVEQPLAYGAPMRMRAEWLDEERIEITSENVRFAVVTTPARTIAIDGTEFGGADAELERPPYAFLSTEAGWQRTSDLAPPASEKSSTRGGPFKRAFDRRFVLVVGTRGDARESEELLARARHDALQWWYRGNGHAPIVTDERFLATSSAGRNVILYGNRDTNAAWDAVLDADCPIDARRGAIRVGAMEHAGDALGALFVRPRRGETEALVGVCADSGPRGTRLGLVLAPFVSGVGYPDWAVFDERILTEGDGGVLDAGWFAHDWTMQ